MGAESIAQENRHQDAQVLRRGGRLAEVFLPVSGGNLWRFPGEDWLVPILHLCEMVCQLIDDPMGQTAKVLGVEGGAQRVVLRR